MYDFENLTRSLASSVPDVPNSFVGIKGNILYIPIGIDTNINANKSPYDENKELFFLLYRTLRKFIGRLKKDKYSAKDRDGAGEGFAKKRFTIETEDGSEEVVYTRLSGIDNVLDGFDELRLFALRERMRSSDEIDYSQIHRYMDKAMYLNNGTIYIDQMQVTKPTLNYHTTDLVRMYCYIYREIKCELKEDKDIGLEVVAEAENFQEHHLSPDDSLFGEHSHARTRDLLCEQLERIAEQTAFKDDAYWHFYEAIEAILYPQNRKDGDDGTHWGINNFCYVWEDMCQDTLECSSKYNILYADRLDGIHSIGDLQTSLTISAEVSIDPCGKITSKIKPDAVVELKGRPVVGLKYPVIGLKTGVQKNTESPEKQYQDALSKLTKNGNKGYRIIDFKYKLIPDPQDKRKQLIYQFALEKNKNRSVQNVFMTPSEYKERGYKGIENKYWQVSIPMKKALIDYAND